MTDDEATIRATLRGNFEASFEDSVKRALEVRHNPIIPRSHFARASSECVEIYRLGYFVATAMATQAVAQGIVKFVAERNELGSNKDKTVLITSLENDGFISRECGDALRRILRRHRNDISHMNPPVGKIDIEEIAKENLSDLALVEQELFAATFDSGKIVPKYRQYWDVEGQSIEVFLRFG